MYELAKKFREVFLAILPVAVLVVLIHFFVAGLSPGLLGSFFLGALFVWIGLSLFLFGVDSGITPIGELFGKTMAKSKNVVIILVAAFALGLLITIAEPDLLIVANIVDILTEGDVAAITLVVMVAVFIGLFIALGLFRILFKIPLFMVLLGAYLVILVLILFVDVGLHGIAFDISGATTGAITVPFVLAIAIGVSSMQRYGKSAEKDSFGLIGIASSGAIIACLVLLLGTHSDGSLIEITSGTTHGFITTMLDAALAMSPLLLITILANIFVFKVRFPRFRRYLFGFLFAFIGLTLFLYGVYSGFLDVGRAIGDALSQEALWLVVLASFLLGVFAILAEPAVYILTNQISDVTAGSVSRRPVKLVLAIGVGLALVLNVLRIIVPGLELWHLLLPGYALALGLMFLTPKLFVGIAFDAGGVASGPIAATFIFATSQGIALADGAMITIADAFGMIAMIALVPIITIEFFGVVYKYKSQKRS